ncbi:hypothetical protein [Candidatus Sororendozoicomonas aggregata]|uniref:hypothetical protein n=1 Tax=Candidatus Sororendozoicomonas aggregata TaxID=3073239 RepID=UPI002ED33573
MKKPQACDRTFPLSNYAKHNNTSLVAGGYWRKKLQKDEDGKSIFSGFVFRGDRREPSVIFEEGFVPRGEFNQSVSIDQRMDRLTGNMSGGFTLSYGVSTCLSSRIAQFYVKLYNPTIKFHNSFYTQSKAPSRTHVNWCTFDGYIYLIDARDMAGYAISLPKVYKKQELLAGKPQKFLHKIYEVNFIHAIPNTSIVGAVWSDNFVTDDICRNSEEWVGLEGIELTLGENPEYEKDAADVAELFK